MLYSVATLSTLLGSVTGFNVGLRPPVRTLPVYSASRSGLAATKAQEGGGTVLGDSESSSWTEKQRQIFMEANMNGVEAGGWDNDEYLEATKSNKPSTSNQELLRQALAYVSML
jgi:hypothetical protein